MTPSRCHDSVDDRPSNQMFRARMLSLAELKSRFGDDTVPVVLQLKQLLKRPETDVAAVLQAAKLYELDIESLTLVKPEAERWALSVTVFQTIKEAQSHAHQHVPQYSHSLENSVDAFSLQRESREVFLSIKKAENLSEE